MKFSCFSKFSAGFRFSAKPSHGEAIYRQMANTEGSAFATGQNTHNGARLFATAMTVARARYTSERCANQMFAATVTELLPVLEKQYGLAPLPTDTLAVRRSALAAKMLLSQGNNQAAVSSALSAALGSDFLYYRVTKPAEIVAWPTSPGDHGHWPTVGYSSKLLKLDQNISVTGSMQIVQCAQLISGDTGSFSEGDTVVVGANNVTQHEKVTVLGGGVIASIPWFAAVFTKAHDLGDICTTGAYPYWISTQLHALVVVTPAAALNREKRRLVNNIVRDMARGVSTWSIAPSTDGANTDSFKIGDATRGRIGYATIGSRAFP